MSEHDLQALRALTAAREKHEELGELLDFYHDLYQVQFEAKARLPEPEIRDEMAARWRLEGGIPQLTYDQLGVTPGDLSTIVSEVTEVLSRHNPSWQFEAGVRSAEVQVELAREVFETWDTLTTPVRRRAMSSPARGQTIQLRSRLALLWHRIFSAQLR